MPRSLARYLPILTWGRAYSRSTLGQDLIAALIVLQAPIVTGHLALTIASGAAVALIWSFGRDILWLWRHRS